MTEKRITCWHFLQGSRRLRWGTKEIVEVDKTYTAKGPLKMCKNGMHGSRRLIDALEYAPGAILCKTQIWGEIEEDTNKLIGRNRKVLAMADVTKTLHEAACHFAETALKLIDCKDERSWNAIKVKRAWLKGKATDKQLSVAEAAAWAVARPATWNAAWGAARGAAQAAAEAAAWAVARSAAWSATWGAAEAAAWAVARSAARSATWGAARDVQNKYLIIQANKLFANGKRGK